MTAAIFFALTLSMLLMANRALCTDIRKSDIRTVNDENRYAVLHPDLTFTPFNSFYNAKGNIFFKLGERIRGDSVILTYMESTSYTRPTDVEVSIWYPADGQNGYSISCIEFVTDLTTKEAAAYLIGEGGIFKRFAETLLVANRTNRLGFQYVVYGF